jgi:DNA-binding response OmpR family regulator
LAKILVVEDDDELQDLLKIELTGSHHTVEVAGSGEEALELLEITKFDLILLDVTLPGISGVEMCKTYREQGNVTPILMLTGNRDINDKTTGLDSGADDYLTKPFDTRELHARLRSLLRRGHAATSNKLTARNITLDIDSREVTRDGVSIKLLPKEFALLQFLILNPNKCFKAEALLDRVWQSDRAVTLSTVYTTLKTLRDKVSPGDNELIENVHGVGYKLVI